MDIANRTGCDMSACGRRDSGNLIPTCKDAPTGFLAQLRGILGGTPIALEAFGRLLPSRK